MVLTDSATCARLDTLWNRPFRADVEKKGKIPRTAVVRKQDLPVTVGRSIRWDEVMSRVGVFGGTFDPPHIAHLVLVSEVRHALRLDEVRFVVAGEPWQKTGVRTISSAQDRFDMVAAAIAGASGLTMSDVELRRDGPSYSVDTLREFAGDSPADEFFLILGADAAAGLDSWHSSGDLNGLCELVVVDRPGERGLLPPSFTATRVESPSMDLSSTALRQRVADGRSIRYMVPDGVVSIIESRGLYRDADG